MKYERLTTRNEYSEVWVSGKDDDDVQRKLMKMANRLAELEDKIESGKMIELPCKISDPVYTVFLDDDNEYKIAKTQCFGFNIREDGIEIITGFCCYDPFRYGKFTDKSQAEARLKELQNE